MSRRFVRPLVRATWALCMLAGAAAAQTPQTPLTGERMGTGVAPAAATPLPPATSPFETTASPPAPGAPARREIGDATRALLRLQAAGTYAAPARPMLGDQASLAYQRYLDSFKYPIPERFDFNLKQSQDGGH
ncbi:DUF3613 domain-containing protein [Stenotrophomonas sp. HITSZ_GD]|uniref:DUF3613 domain-containing protein n=1 Tax=Stenotrophomonas sp. HITSZ_GD TaxID=3037248 RepID=UPI00240E4917|nr:DUF3613 domain-containing protein [Stenotrophomonas sp. HITSZ_GD]MDG2524435.1 DUF3613 domain-containing protein [Stenotrophomonas sp. HITSZ_GD]